MYIFIVGISGFIILLSMFKSHHFFKNLIMSSMQGIVALFSVNFIGDMFEFHIAYNWFSVFVSAVGSLPGVIFLVFSDMINKLI